MIESVEVVIFGKGYGECILLHLGKKWIVIDSFIDVHSKEPIALKYLKEHCEDYSNIVGIICTHWDNDHIKGISNIIESLDFVVPVCMPIVKTNEKFSEYVTFYGDENIDLTSEFIKVYDLYRDGKCSIVNAISGRTLMEKEIGDSTVCIKALSPNDNQFEVFLNAVVIPQKGQIKSIPFQENMISVVTYVKTCVDALLFGGDMENSKLGGWDDICESFCDDKKCHIFKVPHHGSDSADNKKIWNCLVDNPISIITRFNNSHLPTEEMVKSIDSKSFATYIVGPKPKKDKRVVRELKKFDKSSKVISVSLLDDGYGYVRLKKDIEDSTWNIEEVVGAVEKYHR